MEKTKALNAPLQAEKLGPRDSEVHHNLTLIRWAYCRIYDAALAYFEKNEFCRYLRGIDLLDRLLRIEET
jgi:hypothetical protein